MPPLTHVFAEFRLLWAQVPAAARRPLGLLLFSAVNFGLCRLGLALTPGDASVALFWPSAGLVFGALLVAERRRWPELLLAAGLPIAAFNALAGQPPLLVAAFAGVNALEPTLSAMLVLLLCGGRPQLGNRNHILGFGIGGPLFTSGFCALLSAAALHGLLSQPLFPLWQHLWAGAGLGMIVVGALVLAWAGAEPAPIPLENRAGLEWLALGVACLIAGYLMFLDKQHGVSPYEVLVLPPLVWIALRHGLRGATAAGFLFVVLALSATVAGRGVFAVGSRPAPSLERRYSASW